MVNYLNSLINRLQIEYLNNDKSSIYGFTQKVFGYNSNRIEGSTLTEEQTASLFDTGTIQVSNEIIKSKDVEEMTGHFMMFNEMLKSYDQPLTVELIKKYHYALKAGVFEDMANGYPIGEFKNRMNIVGSIKTCPPADVPSEIDKLFKWYEELDEYNLDVLAELHIRYERIHPFQDGNGRTGRILLYKECLRRNIVPFVVEDHNKLEYYHALSDVRLLSEFLEKAQKKYYAETKDFVITI